MAPRSMTGFARVEASQDGHHLTMELRSLNHRHLQFKSRLSDSLAPCEGLAEPIVRKRIQRGAVSLNVRHQSEAARSAVSFDRELAAHYNEQLEQLIQELGLAKGPSLQILLSLPGVMQPAAESRNTEQLRAFFVDSLGKILDLLDIEREREGAELALDLNARLDAVDQGLAEFERRYPEQQSAYEARLLERVRRFLRQEGHEAQDLDVVREVALFCEKVDVSEERTRLRAHLREFRRLLDAGEDVGIGRRLDFLTQELLRETHTMGAKTVEGELSHVVLAMRAELERVKEQVQNLE
ncbi:MAG: YicC family protein [Planctomycetota bacterium]|nr:MAG: YicC family protein [Planctomycetota bacterium]